MRYILAIFLPPIAVLTTGRIGSAILNFFLCLLFWIPGIIHAMVVISDYKTDKKMKRMLRAMSQQQNVNVNLVNNIINPNDKK